MSAAGDIRLTITTDGQGAIAAISPASPELDSLLGLNAGLVVAELRPTLESLRARRRVCDHCGLPFLQKQRHKRRRAFHSAACRVAANRT